MPSKMQLTTHARLKQLQLVKTEFIEIRKKIKLRLEYSSAIECNHGMMKTR